MATAKSPRQGGGRERLVDAAIRLSGRTRSLHAVGIRELAREAGLNPNTFYRHFRNHDELGLAVLGRIVETLREPLRALRAQATEQALADSGPAADLHGRLNTVARVVDYCLRGYFEFATRHPEAFVIGGRELNGPSPVLRQAIREAMDLFADDLAEDMAQIPLHEALERNALREIAGFVIRQTFHVSLDYIERPAMRETICRRLRDQLLMMLVGAGALKRLSWHPSAETPAPTAGC